MRIINNLELYTGRFFVNEGLWAIVGVLLGFGGTYALQILAENRRKKQLRTVARNIIGLEIIYNLEIIGQIEKSTLSTIKDVSLLHTSQLPPRSEVLERLLDLPSLSVLDNVEQKLVTEMFSQLNTVSRDYSLWPYEIRQVAYNVQAMKAVSQKLLEHITILRMNLVQLLCETCLREKTGLQEKRLLDIYSKLQKFENEKSGRTGKSSDYKQAREKGWDKYKRLVVWEHDWPECHIEIMELRSITEANSS